MMSAHYPTDKGVAARVEELLREQLLELGEDPASLAPHLIMQNMQCEVYPDESMVYIWKDIPILRVVPERTSKKKRAEPAPPFSYAERLPFFKEDSLSR